jgi:hypothetical protein
MVDRPKVTCAICNKPVSLDGDTCADENGKAAHKDCYVTTLVASQAHPPHPGHAK